MVNSATAVADTTLSLYLRLEPEGLADPYPLYHRLREQHPVYWDPYMHAWVVTGYADVVHALQHFRSERTPTPEQLTAYEMEELNPVAQVLVRQMLFLDPPAHTRLRALAAAAFTPARVQALNAHIQEITDRLIDAVVDSGRMEVMADLADPLPATVTSELMGVPVEDRDRLKELCQDFSEMLGNFQHNPGRVRHMLKVTEELTSYFKAQLEAQKANPRRGVVDSFRTAEIDGNRFSEEEVVANCIITLVGGLETTTNLIGNGLLTLLRNPEEFERLQANPAVLTSGIEEMLRYESPVQHTVRLSPGDIELGGKRIRNREAVMTVLAAANRDPERFADPDRFDLAREDNRHLAFGWGAHYCFGAALARTESQIAFRTILRRLKNLALEPVPLRWRNNIIFRGLDALHITFESSSPRGSGCVQR